MFNITWDKGVASPSDHHDVSNHEMFGSIARYCANVTGRSLRSQHDLIHHYGVPLRMTVMKADSRDWQPHKCARNLSWVRRQQKRCQASGSGIVLTHYSSGSTLPVTSSLTQKKKRTPGAALVFTCRTLVSHDWTGFHQQHLNLQTFSSHDISLWADWFPVHERQWQHTGSGPATDEAEQEEAWFSLVVIPR